MPDTGDLMLFALSAWRTASWDAFKKMFDHLRLHGSAYGRFGPEEATQFERLRTALVLDSLGHCDVHFGRTGGQIVVAPAVLAALPAAGLPRAVLCGARGPDTVAAIRSAANKFGRNLTLTVSTQRSSHPYAPSKVELQADSETIFVQLADQLRIRYSSIPPAWSLSYCSGGIAEYLKSLSWSSEPEINWPHHDFDTGSMQFMRPADKRPEIRLTRYQDPVRSTWTYRLWHEQKNAEVDVSWGRYAILCYYRRRAVVYDEDSCTASAPRTVPLPRLMTRALVLCSGSAPNPGIVPLSRSGQVRHRDLDVYAGVPQDVFSAIESKMGQDAESVPLLGDLNG